MSVLELLQKTDRTHDESEALVSALTDVLKKSSILVAYYHKLGFKHLRSRPKEELEIYIELQESIARLSQ